MKGFVRNVTAVVILMLSLNVPAMAGGATSSIIERKNYPLPTWTDAVERTDLQKYATENEYVLAAKDSRFVLEKIRYRSDGLAVVALLCRAATVHAAKQPVIVFNRGSFVRKDIAPELLPMFHRLASAGFAVIAPMYRGSDGGEGRDEMGGDDVNDVMNVAPLLAEIEALDPDNVFLYGESRGGMMVFQAIRDGFAARAAATFGAFTDLDELFATGTGTKMASKIWPDFPQRRGEIAFRRSAMSWPEKLRLPLLLMHGGKDLDVSATQTLRLAHALAKAGNDVGVSVFPGDNHRLSTNRVERDRQAVEFFRARIGK